MASLMIFSTRLSEVGRDQFTVSNNRNLLLRAFRRLLPTTLALLPLFKPIATAILRLATSGVLPKGH